MGVCSVVAVLIVALAAFRPIKNWWDLRQFSNVAIDKIGAPASVCGKETTKKATGNQQHVSDGQAIFYDDAPPAFGEHYNTPDPMERKLYSEGTGRSSASWCTTWSTATRSSGTTRPSPTTATQMNELRAIADKFAGTSNLRFKFKAVPWLESDGKSFPEGQHIAFTHWSIGGADQDPAGDGQVGVWQYCTDVSGDALNAFMLKYPYMDSPEPTAM